MDWMELLNQALSIIIPAAATALAGWFAILGANLKKTYDEKAKTETAKLVVNDVVRFIQQVYVDLEGPAKLQKAIEQASGILQGKGIQISDVEISMLIESCVYGLKEGMTKETTEVIEETNVNENSDITVKSEATE